LLISLLEAKPLDVEIAMSVLFSATAKGVTPRTVAPKIIDKYRNLSMGSSSR